MEDQPWQRGAPSRAIMVAGLGNPGERYARTRHNMGFWAMELLRRHAGLPGWTQCGARGRRYDRAMGAYEDRTVTIIRPLEYMNHSGPPVATAMHTADIGSNALVVCHDDLDLPPGSIRLKFGGGTAGHRGLKSIIEAIGTKDFLRIRLGIGRAQELSTTEYVLEELEDDHSDMKQLLSAAEGVPEAFDILVDRGLGAAQSVYHQRS